MEQLVIRVIDGVNKPLLGEEFTKRDYRDGIMKHYRLHEIVHEQREKGFDFELGMVEWTDITYNMIEVAPTE